MMSKHFAGARIHALRKTYGLTQVEMAKQLNLSTSYLNQLENDQRPLTVTVLIQLSEAFNVDTTYFSADRDLRVVNELRSLFPTTEDDTLHDLASRFPELMPKLVSIAQSDPVEATPSPLDMVQKFFFESHNYIHELDVLAEELAAKLGDKILRLNHLANLLDREFDVHVRFGRSSQTERRIYEASSRELSLRAGLSDAQLTFQLAMQYCLLAYPEVLDNLVHELPEGLAQHTGRYGLAQYFAAAVTLPYTDFLETAENTRYDIDRIASIFGTGFETTAQRLTTLQRPGARGVPFVFIRTDRAGNISKRQSATSFHFSRTGGSCPLWAIHRAFETPNRITRQVATMPDGHTYMWIARHVQGQVKSFGTPRKEFAVGLGCNISQADKLIYSDALNLSPASATPIGPGCTICPREACPQRAFPQAGREHALDLNTTSDTPFDVA